ncbi:hypothetical protein GQ53DRAFT_815385 [Thozetella sp. PMI_491]|nr:hypothetical protein GQ53DRAFT_815385 [Thozetella sp. PMI_491]
MQFKFFGTAALLATGMSAAAVLDKRDAVAVKLTWYKNVNCNGLVGELSTNISTVAANKAGGDCATIAAGSRPMKSVKVSDLYQTCTVTLYSDEYCSENPTSATKGTCVSRSGEFKSLSVDSCPDS